MGAPVVIHKHPIGLVAIFIVGLALFDAMAAGMYYQLRDNGRTPFAMLLAAAAVLVLIGTATQAYVYYLSTITLTDLLLKASNYATIFAQNVAECEWANVQDIDVKKGGVFAMIFDYGTLLVQTAGTERNLKLPMIPRAEYWRDYMMNRADTAAHRVSVSEG